MPHEGVPEKKTGQESVKGRMIPFEGAFIFWFEGDRERERVRGHCVRIYTGHRWETVHAPVLGTFLCHCVTPFRSLPFIVHQARIETQADLIILKPTDVRTMDDLLPPGAEPGTMPTDENQATGLERLELLGKMQGVDIFDMRPLDASRKGTSPPPQGYKPIQHTQSNQLSLLSPPPNSPKPKSAADSAPLTTGTLDNPIIVYSAGDEYQAGCTGYPADSHWTIWLAMDRARPIERCTECGSVYRMEYIGPPDDDGHGHGHGHGHGEGEPEYDVYRDGHPDLIAEVKKPRFSDLVRPEYRWN